MGVVGTKIREEVSQAMYGIGSIEIPDPAYGYLRASQLAREWADRNLKNDWAGRDLEGLTYVDSLGATEVTDQSCVRWQTVLAGIA